MWQVARACVQHRQWWHLTYHGNETHNSAHPRFLRTLKILISHSLWTAIYQGIRMRNRKNPSAATISNRRTGGSTQNLIRFFCGELFERRLVQIKLQTNFTIRVTFVLLSLSSWLELHQPHYTKGSWKPYR